MSKVQETDVVENIEVQEKDDSVEEVIKLAREKLSARQRKELGLAPPKKPRTERQKANDMRLGEKQKIRHQQERKEAEAYEIAQLKKLNIADLNAYNDFLQFKKLRALAEEKPDAKAEKKVQPKKVVEETVDDDSEDGFIQKKTKKAQKIVKAVEEIDNKISKLQVTAPVNPYLDAFNKMKK